MATTPPKVQFEHAGATLTAARIVRSGCSPVIGSLHGALLALGIVVSSYRARPEASGLMERVELEQRDGTAIDEPLGATTRQTILRLARNR